MQFSSSDFDTTSPQLKLRLPDKLIHIDVWKTGQRSRFSSERKHAVAVTDLPTKTLSVTLGGLEPAEATNRHRHNYETVLYILEGKGQTVVEDRVIEWQKGDAVYVPVWAWHQHRNSSASERALYLACENAPLLQNLGEIALREEAND